MRSGPDRVGSILTGLMALIVLASSALAPPSPTPRPSSTPVVEPLP